MRYSWTRSRTSSRVLKPRIATEDSFEVADAGVRTAATDNRRLRLAGARNVAFAIASTAAAPRTKAIAEFQTRARAALQLLFGYLVSRRSPLRGWSGGRRPASRRGGPCFADTENFPRLGRWLRGDQLVSCEVARHRAPGEIVR